MPAPPFPPVALLTYAEAMAALRCSKATLARFVAAGELPSVKIGKSRRFDAADVRDFIDRNRTSAPLAPAVEEVRAAS